MSVLFHSQEVTSAIGSPNKVFYKSEDKMRIHAQDARSEEHTSELQSRPHISYAVFCLKKKKKQQKKKRKKKKKKKKMNNN